LKTQPGQSIVPSKVAGSIITTTASRYNNNAAKEAEDTADEEDTNKRKRNSTSRKTVTRSTTALRLGVAAIGRHKKAAVNFSDGDNLQEDLIEDEDREEEEKAQETSRKGSCNFYLEFNSSHTEFNYNE
jgi:hypothetical protein